MAEIDPKLGLDLFLTLVDEEVWWNLCSEGDTTREHYWSMTHDFLLSGSDNG